MKKSKLVLLSLGMALCVGGGVGAALAITKTGSTSSGTSVYDKAINLYWGNGASAVTLSDMDTLEVNVAQYRYLRVASKSSATVAGTVTVAFTLGTNEATGKTAVSKGIAVDVFATDSLADDTTVETAIASKTAVVSLAGTTTTGNATFTVAAGDQGHETAAYYAIRVVYDGTQIGDDEVLSCNLSIAQSFAA